MEIDKVDYEQISLKSVNNPIDKFMLTQQEILTLRHKMKRITICVVQVESGFFSHVVGNGRSLKTWLVDRGAYDVGGGWNVEGYAQVELIESHESKEGVHDRLSTLSSNYYVS